MFIKLIGVKIMSIDINYLNNDALGEVLSGLALADISKSCLVCKRWNAVAIPLLDNMALKVRFPTLTVIDADTWNDYIHLEALGLQFKGLSPICTRTTRLALKELFSSPLINSEAGITILELPEGLSLDTFDRISNSRSLLKKGNASKIGYFATFAAEAIGKAPPQKPYRIAIANTILSGSQNLTYSEQEDLIAKLPGCERTGALAVVALMTMSYLITSDEKSPTRLFGIAPTIYTCCHEQVDLGREQDFRVTVGCFAPPPKGLIVDYECDGEFEKVGVTPMRKI
jgi:hypothetical protein